MRSDEISHTDFLENVNLQESEILDSLERLEMEVEELQERLDYLSTKRDTVQQELEHIMDSVQEVLKQKKEQLVDTLNDLFTTERQRILIDIRDKQTLVSEEQVSELGDQVSTLNDERITKDGGGPRLTFKDFVLDISADDVAAAVKEINFGDLHVIHDERALVEEGCIGAVNSVHNPFNKSLDVKTMRTRIDGDEFEPKLNDIAVIEVGMSLAVVVTDRANVCLKSFYKIGDLSSYSFERFPEEPRGIARLGDIQVGVTFPQALCIRIFKVTPLLAEVRKLKTKKPYRGITRFGYDKIAVSTFKSYPASVDILNLQGKILHSVVTHSDGDNLFHSPFYICAAHDRIIVSDCHQKTISCVTETGEVMKQMNTELSHPLGVTMDGSGNVLVVDCDSHRVIKMNPDLDSSEVLLEQEGGIEGPYGISTDSSGAIYVAQWNGTVKIFN